MVDPILTKDDMVEAELRLANYLMLTSRRFDVCAKCKMYRNVECVVDGSVRRHKSKINSLTIFQTVAF
jgi:hypothetical protein